MSRLAASTAVLRKVDPMWSRIREEAEAIAAADPALGGFVFTSVLGHDSFADALSQRLAQKLAHADVGAELIFKAFQEAMAADPTIIASARVDLMAVYDRDPACGRYIEPLLYFKGYHAIQTYRMAHALWGMGRKDFALYVQSRSSQVFSVDIHPAARIGSGIMIDHAHAIVIGETAEVGDDVSLLHDVTLGGTGKELGDRHPKVRHGVLIGAGARILGNIEIGPCSRVAAGSVVLQDVPPNTTVAGVPARVVGYAGCLEPSRRMDHVLLDEEEGSEK